MHCIRCGKPTEQKSSFCSDCLATATKLENPEADKARIAASTPHVSSKHARWIEGVRNSPSLGPSAKLNKRRKQRSRKARRRR